MEFFEKVLGLISIFERVLGVEGMNKILSFIINEDKELLLLQGSPNDPQLKKSICYVVTGSCENTDNSMEDTVKREVAEETGLNALDIIYLNWVFKYKSLGKKCTEHAYMTFVQKTNIKLNEESIGYKWCDIDEFIEKIDWLGDKNKLKNVLKKAINKEIFFKIKEIEEYKRICYGNN